MHYEIDDLKAATASFIASIDRSALGCFASNPDIFAIAESTRRGRLAQELGDTVAEDYKEHFDKLLLDAVSWADLEAVYSHAYIEVVFWWTLSDDPVLKEHANGHYDNDTDKEWWFLFHLAYGNPELHPYFAQGITKYDQARNFFDAGIDAELARSLVA